MRWSARCRKSEGTGAGSLLVSGKLAELAALTGGSGVVGSMARAPTSKARQRFEGAAKTADPVHPDPDATRKPEFVIVDHELSPSQIRNLERATGAQVLDRTGVIVEISTATPTPARRSCRWRWRAGKMWRPACGNPRLVVGGSRAQVPAKVPWPSTGARSATGFRS